MIDLSTWARLPLVLGFPAFSKPLFAMRKAVESLETKLAYIKTQIAEVEANPLIDCTVLSSYETEMELILRQALAYRKRIIAASVKFASGKIRETYTFMSEQPESATLSRLKKLSVICRTLLKKVSVTLTEVSGLERDALNEFSEVLTQSLKFIRDCNKYEEDEVKILCESAVAFSF